LFGLCSAAVLVLVSGCATAPASTVTTMRAPALAQQTTSVQTPKPAPSTDDGLACGVILAGLTYVDTVKANYGKHDGSAPLPFFQR